MFEPLPMRIEDPALRAAGRALMASIRGESDWLEQVCAPGPEIRCSGPGTTAAGGRGRARRSWRGLYQLPDADTAAAIEAEAAVAVIPALLLRRPRTRSVPPRTPTWR